jgi:hypothetical protein
MARRTPRQDLNRPATDRRIGKLTAQRLCTRAADCPHRARSRVGRYPCCQLHDTRTLPRNVEHDALELGQHELGQHGARAQVGDHAASVTLRRVARHIVIMKGCARAAATWPFGILWPRDQGLTALDIPEMLLVWGE